MPITVLSEETINKIAAGEVVERPANVVKELVENALDAGARTVRVDIRGAGRQMLRVQDDGCGMTGDEIALAVTRHATSKIASFSDLTSLATLGFRGEALPSIAAVSHLRIQSRRSGEPSGWEITLEGGAVRDRRPWAGAPGTTVEVTNLFYNTPARAKFLKSEATERSRIIAFIEEMALARPETGFFATVEGKPAVTAPPAEGLRERARDILGAEFEKTLVEVSSGHPFLNVTGLVTHREASRPARTGQFYFVNRRPITPGKLIHHAVYEAYRENLPAGRHPGVILFLEIAPSEVDVNIHPTKREVRFSREQEIHDRIYRSVKETVAGGGITSLSPVARPAAPVAPPPYPAYRPSAPAAPRVSLAELEALYGRQQELPSVAPEDDGVRVIGQAFNLYVIVEYRGELLIIDQHAAAERVRYEEYRRQWKNRSVAVQPLLLPATMETTPSRVALVRENGALLREAGWAIEEFGATTLRISEAPAVLGEAPVEPLAAGVIDALAAEAKLPPAEKIESVMRTACRASIKAGDAVDAREAERLVRDLMRCESPFTCPHGRPTVFKLSLPGLEKHFGRDY